MFQYQGAQGSSRLLSWQRDQQLTNLSTHQRPDCWAVCLIRRAASDRQATTTYSFHLSVLLKGGQPIAVKIITMEIVSKKSGKAIEVSFPMDEGLFKASFSLPKKKRILFLTEAYHEFNYEEKRKRRLLSLPLIIVSPMPKHRRDFYIESCVYLKG